MANFLFFFTFLSFAFIVIGYSISKYLWFFSLEGEEKQINPFMRVNEGSVQKHAKTSEGIDTMRAIRAEKDGFRPPPL